jgi:UDP-glucuronate 4-epimerase
LSRGADARQAWPLFYRKEERTIMTILLTGAAGFIGYHVAEALLARGETVLGVDDLNPYYDVRLKHARLQRLARRPAFRFVAAGIADREAMLALVAAAPELDRIVHLAAQAGVRHSLVAPFDYVTSNLQGQLVILEIARHLKRLRHLVYASSSSVYGSSEALPFREDDRCDTPLSLYAATKRGGEMMGHAYAHLFAIPMTGLRFFTVYGPWGRPDMAYFSFAEAILSDEPITVYDGGDVERDFTYIDDIVQGVVGCLDHPPDPADGVPARVLNIGNTRAEKIGALIAALEAALGRRAVIVDTPRPRADVRATLADVGAISALTGYAPTTPLSVGVPRFAEWFLEWRRQRG